jgi:hypothetical protein
MLRARQIRRYLEPCLGVVHDVAAAGNLWGFTAAWTRYLKRCLRRNPDRTFSSLMFFELSVASRTLFGDM